MNFNKKIDRLLDTAERVVAIIRPKFHNRIAWIVVGAGLMLVAGPWWQDIVNAVAERYLNVVLSPRDGQPWGGLLVAFGLAYHLVAQHITELVATRRAATSMLAEREHDRLMFKDLVEKMSEENLDSFFCDLQDDHAYFSRQWQMLIAGSRQLESRPCHTAALLEGAVRYGDQLYR